MVLETCQVKARPWAEPSQGRSERRGQLSRASAGYVCPRPGLRPGEHGLDQCGPRVLKDVHCSEVNLDCKAQSRRPAGEG